MSLHMFTNTFVGFSSLIQFDSAQNHKPIHHTQLRFFNYALLSHWWYILFIHLTTIVISNHDKIFHSPKRSSPRNGTFSASHCWLVPTAAAGLQCMPAYFDAKPRATDCCRYTEKQHALVAPLRQIAVSGLVDRLSGGPDMRVPFATGSLFFSGSRAHNSSKTKQSHFTAGAKMRMLQNTSNLIKKKSDLLDVPACCTLHQRYHQHTN